jgi:hypothetical protein
MTHKNLWQTIAVCVAAAVSGCDASGSTTDMSIPSVTPAEACPALIKAYCAKAQACYPFAWQIAWPDAATCETRINLTCPQLAQVMGTRVTGSDLQACAAKLTNLSCEDYFALSSPIQACGFPSGTLTDGSACGEDVQCQSLYCKKDAGLDCGKCTVASKSGGVCTTSSDCEKGLACVGAAGARQCTAYLQLGASCSTASNSVPCISTLACRNGTCATPAKLGESCSTTAQDCDKLSGLSCPVAGKCVAPATAQLGGTCGQQGSTYILCTGGTSCDSATKKCVAPSADGGSCVPSGTPGCQAPAKCATSVCKIPDPSLCK